MESEGRSIRIAGVPRWPLIMPFDEGDGIPPGECAVVRFRLSRKYEGYLDEEHFDKVIKQRKLKANKFY